MRPVSSEEIVQRLVATGKWSEEQARLGIQCRFKCEYCGVDFLAGPEAYKLWELDHIVPRCDGGSETFDNLAIACRNCNTWWKRDWNPLHHLPASSTRAERILAAKQHILGRRAQTAAQLEEVRGITGWKPSS